MRAFEAEIRNRGDRSGTGLPYGLWVSCVRLFPHARSRYAMALLDLILHREITLRQGGISVGDEGKAVRIPKFTAYSQKALEFGGNI